MLGIKPGDTILVLGDVERGLAIPTKETMNKHIAMLYNEMTAEAEEAHNE